VEEARQPAPLGARRSLAFKVHLAAYIGLAVVLVVVNLILSGTVSWALLFVVGWGAPLAVHCAYAMNLFGGGGR
jgi:hypothetical protein